MISYIKSFFQKIPTEIDILKNEVNRIYSFIPQDFGGGCSVDKALTMSMVIKEFNLKQTVDIGVYRGRSLFPQAIAHKLFSKGIVFGIDPFTKEAADQKDYPEIQEKLDSFVLTTDFQKLYDDVASLIHTNRYQDNCVLIRKKSSDAAIDFKEKGNLFDLVHIDGNHDTKFVLEDVNNYLPLLNKKGFIVLDDISWKSVLPAFKILKDEMKLIGQLINPQNDFALFGRGLSENEMESLKKTFIKANIKLT